MYKFCPSLGIGSEECIKCGRKSGMIDQNEILCCSCFCERIGTDLQLRSRNKALSSENLQNANNSIHCISCGQDEVLFDQVLQRISDQVQKEWWVCSTCSQECIDPLGELEWKCILLVTQLFLYMNDCNVLFPFFHQLIFH